MAEHNLVLFAISTCMRCSQAKAFLNRHHAKYDLIHVDLIAEAQR
ncbi:MAG: glutaredoxin family protein, partial [Desulfovibrionaceae bacterium]|nr:glutaredoxin family protein [Desulfovibrionaceae bacterium]